MSNLIRVEDGEKEYVSWMARTVMVSESSPYFRVLSQMHSVIFTPRTEGDTNRAEDGKALRRDFVFDSPSVKNVIDDDFYSRPCTFLEMVVGVAAKMAHLIDKTTASCFWHIMSNLGLDGASPHPARVKEAIELVNGRKYDDHGSFGMFPLKDPAKDQREEQILNQMYAYVLENELH